MELFGQRADSLSMCVRFIIYNIRDGKKLRITQQHKQYDHPGEKWHQSRTGFMIFTHVNTLLSYIVPSFCSITCSHLLEFKMLSMCLDVSWVRSHWLATYLNKRYLQNSLCPFYVRRWHDLHTGTLKYTAACVNAVDHVGLHPDST